MFMNIVHEHVHVHVQVFMNMYGIYHKYHKLHTCSWTYEHVHEHWHLWILNLWIFMNIKNIHEHVHDHVHDNCSWTSQSMFMNKQFNTYEHFSWTCSWTCSWTFSNFSSHTKSFHIFFRYSFIISSLHNFFIS